MTKSTRRSLRMAWALFVGWSPSASSQDSTPAYRAESCLGDLDSMVAIVSRDYSGYQDKSTGNESRIAALTDSVRIAVRVAPDPYACTDALRAQPAGTRGHDTSATEG